MVNYIDLILMAIMALIIFLSVKNGFFKTLFDLVAYFAAFGLAKNLSPLLAKNAFDSFIRPGAESYLESAFVGIENIDYASRTEQVMDSIPEGLRGLLEIIGLSSEEISEKLSSVSFNSENVVQSIIDAVIEPIGVALMQFIIFVILGVVLLIAAKIIVRLLNGIVKKLPIIKRFNSLLGGVLGFVKAGVVVIVIAGVISVIASTSANQSFIETVGDSILVNSFTDIIGDFSL